MTTADAIIALELGHYRLREQIGGSAYGIIWRASGPQATRDVAIKLINREQMERALPAQRERWINAANNEIAFAVAGTVGRAPHRAPARQRLARLAGAGAGADGRGPGQAHDRRAERNETVRWRRRWAGSRSSIRRWPRCINTAGVIST
jgi:hypothetical protein